MNKTLNNNKNFPHAYLWDLNITEIHEGCKLRSLKAKHLPSQQERQKTQPVTSNADIHPLVFNEFLSHRAGDVFLFTDSDSLLCFLLLLPRSFPLPLCGGKSVTHHYFISQSVSLKKKNKKLPRLLPS